MVVVASSTDMLCNTDTGLSAVCVPTHATALPPLLVQVHDALVEAGAYPSPLNYYNFPKSVCTSVNEVWVLQGGLGGSGPGAIERHSATHDVQCTGAGQGGACSSAHK